MTRPTMAAATSMMAKSTSGQQKSHGKKEVPGQSQMATAKWQHGWGELSEAEMTSRIAQLQEMGFSMSAARSSLEVCDWDVNRALDSLFLHKVPPNSQGTTLDDLDIGKSSSSLGSISTSASGGSSPLIMPQKNPSLQDSLCDPTIPPVPLFWPSLPETRALSESLPRGSTAALVSHVMGSQGLNTMPTAKVAGPSQVSVVPKRTLAKVQHTWTCDPESADTQLSIEEGTFVHVWAESRTETGWVYAESLMCSSRAGWLPASMLQSIPPSKRWMGVSKPCHAVYQTQLPVEVGNMVLVDVTQTPVGDGWIFAEELSSASGRSTMNGCGTSGWVPIQCIKWAEV